MKNKKYTRFVNSRLLPCLITVIVFTLSFGLTSLAASFTDVPETNNYYAAIENLKALKIINGYADGTFKPAQSVNRAEALKMVMNAGNILVPKGLYASGFKDVGLGEWYAGYVMYGTMNGIVKGNPDGTFAPTRTVNKAEYLKMLLITFKTDLSAHQNISGKISSDTSPGDWFIPYLSYAKTVGIIYPDLNNRLDPAKKLNRGECADILYKMYVLKNGGETQKLLSLAESKLVDSIVKINENNLFAALSDANEAAFFSGSALSRDPNSSVTQAANKIAVSFQKLYTAYKAALENNPDTARSLVGEAQSLAREAFNINNSTQLMADKIIKLGDDLLRNSGM
jgi:hypothetical protein